MKIKTLHFYSTIKIRFKVYFLHIHAFFFKSFKLL